MEIGDTTRVEFSERLLEIANRHVRMPSLLQDLIAEIRTFVGCDAVGIRILRDDGTVPYEALAGFGNGFHRSGSPLSIHTDRSICTSVIKGTAAPALPFLTPGGSFHANGTTRLLAALSEDHACSVCNACKHHGHQSVALIPIRVAGTIIGLIHLADQRVDAFSEDTVQTLQRTASYLAGALERVRETRQLRESESRFRAITEKTSELTLILSSEGNLKYVSPSARRVLGYQPQDLLGETFAAFLHPDDLGSFDQSLERARQMPGQPCSLGDFRAGHRYGRWVYLDCSATALPDVSGVEGIVVTCRDVTRRKDDRQKLRAYTNALESANRCLEEHSFAAQEATLAKSEFLASMSHEIRTPMTAILGFSEMLLTEGDISQAPPHRIDAIRTIVRNGEYLLELINDILDLSKIEAGRLEIEKIPCQPVEIIREVLQLMQVRADAKNLPLEVEARGPLPETIHTDPVRLRQILINLLSNAIKFTETGSVKVAVDLLDSDSTEPMLQLEVTDTGIGMTNGQLTEVFQAFSQATASTTRRFGGTGLGLTISRQLAQMLGGQIEVMSESGSGSTFRLLIAAGPLHGVKMIPDSLAFARTSIQPFDNPGPSHATGQLDCRILLAEDAPDNQRLVSLLLTKAGAHVTAADNGLAAFEMAQTARKAGNPFDLILMDMEMPGKNGYQATEELRRNGYDRPIIALTAHAMTGQRDKCIAAGCDDFIAKPISIDDMLTTVRRNLTSTAREIDSLPRQGHSAALSPLETAALGDAEKAGLLDRYLGLLPKRADAIELALRDRDRELLGTLSQSLHNSADRLGLGQLAAAALELERLLAQGVASAELAPPTHRLANLCRHAAGQQIPD